MVASPLRQTALRSLQTCPQKVHPKKVIAIGDSVIYGYGDSEGGGWVERLRRGWLDPEQPGPIFYNLGVRGDGVQQVARRLEQEFRDRGELRRRQPDVIVLSVGMNDSARTGRPAGRAVTDEATFEQRLRELLAQSRRLCPVFFVGMVPVNEAAMPFAEVLYFSWADQARYNALTRAACAAQRIPYLDIFQQWTAQGEVWCSQRLCRDGLHPNVLGYQTLLQTVQDWQPLMQAIES